MKKENNIQQLRKQCLNKKLFSTEVLEWITKENLWNLWIPKTYGGLESSLTEGLHTLKSLAKIDGSLGWTVTLCSGTNYFIGNLQPQVAQEVFKAENQPILGGSGGVFGTAEKEGDHYILSGNWHYATGTPYISHFTLNAKITKEGKVLKNKDGTDQFLSFLLPKHKVKIIDDWNTMGLLATATQSFSIENELIHRKYSFSYDHFYLPQPIFKIPFSVIADLTLWANYLGIAEHYLEEIKPILTEEKSKNLKTEIDRSNLVIFNFSEEIEELLDKKSVITEEIKKNLHQEASRSVSQLSKDFIEIHPYLGIKAAREDHQLNQIFRDYFTATQHRNFVNR